MLRVEEFGAIAYGGAVTWAEWWDNERIAAGRIASKEVLKKASFYTYLGIGLAAALMSTFNWLPRWRSWTDKMATGFFYDLPRNAVNMQKSLTTAGGGRGSGSAAVIEARKVNERRMLSSGAPTERSYQQEFAHKTFAW